MRRLLGLGISGAIATLALAFIVAPWTTTSTATASTTQTAASEVQLTAGFNMVTYAGPTLPVEEALLVALGADVDAAEAVFSFKATTQQWDTWAASAPSFINTLVELETDRPYFIRATRAALWGSAANEPPPSPFVGAWHTIDVDGDGSNQWVFINHEIDDLFLVRWYEDGGTICDPDTLPPVLLDFTAQQNGNTLSGGIGRAWCQFDGWTEIPTPDISASFEYDESADTITDGLTWQRSDATWPEIAMPVQ
jgi:hypothetical protein